MSTHNLDIPERVGSNRLGAEGMSELDKLLEEAYQKGRADAVDDLPVEYAPGHRWDDRDGNEHWFVQAGTVAPGYVDEYVRNGGEAIKRKVGPWEEVL